MANESPYIMPGVPKNNYELAVDAGFVGTLEEWIASWPKGDPGDAGPRGPEGTVTPEALAAKNAAEAASVSSWNARNEAVSARNTAIEAALDAESHKDAVEAVAATNDGIMTAVAEDPESAFSGALTEQIGAVEEFTGFPNFAKGFTAKPDYSPTNTIVVKPPTDLDPGVIEWAHNSPFGYIFHLVGRPDMGSDAALSGYGVDFDGIGLLVANKKSGRGIVVHNHPTLDGGHACGFEGAQDSTTAPMLQLVQRVTGAAPLIRAYAEGTLGSEQRIAVFGNSDQTIGYIEAAGKLVWQHSAYFKQNVTNTPAVQVEGNSGATQPAFQVIMPTGTAPFEVGATGVVAYTRGGKFDNSGNTNDHALRIVNHSGLTDTLRLVGSGTMGADQISIRDSANAVQSRFNRTGTFITKRNVAPLDADLTAGEVAIWFDATNGDAKVMFKAKEAGGTVRTGSVALA